MRKLLAALLLLCVYSTLSAQSIFYGLTKGNGHGTISKFDASNNSLTAAYTFGSNGTHPALSEFVEGADGKLYSSTAYGGKYNKGVIFSFDPVTLVKTKLFDLSSICTGVLTKAAGTLLYGMTTDHIFSLNTSSGTYTVLYNFAIPEKFPLDGLKTGTDGKFYGVNNESIFSFDPATNVYVNLYTLNYDDNGVIRGGICFGADGKLYGVTIGGENNYQGTIYSFDRSTSVFNIVYEFDSFNGEFPEEPLTLGTNGKLYGTTLMGGAYKGVIFSYAPSTDTYTKLHDFEDNSTAGRWSRDMTRGTDGKIYGVSNAGANGYGVIYSLDPVSGIYTKLHDFDNYNDDEFPSGRLFQASNGKFYGLTYDLDDDEGGKIFSYDAVTDAYALLHRFDNNADGNEPYHSLLKSGDLLFGMTSAGGTTSNGVIFSYNPVTDTYNKLHDFNGTNGAAPHGNLTPATNGLFYGLTKNGGATDNGVLFSFNPSTNTYAKLYDFNTSTGSNPYGSLIQAANGKFYGMTSGGGANALGVIFSFDLSTNTYTKRFDFTTASGGQPRGSLVIGSNGKLYGLATFGGVETYGTIFSFDPTSNVFTRLYEFEYLNGMEAYGDLLLASDGLFYGVSSRGGSQESGVLFSLDPVSNIVTNLHDFYVYENPFGTLVEDNGKLYGMTSSVDDKLGYVFSYALINHTFTKLQDFDGTNGARPVFGFLTRYGPGSAPTPPSKFIKVNVYSGTNPYANTEWNNWNSNTSLLSGNLKYSDGSNSSVNATLSQQNSVSDNGTPYNSTMAPPEVIRYSSYSTLTRTLTISGLDNSKTYDLEIYASRKGVSNNTSRFTIGASSIDILTDNNLANKALFTSLSPNSSQIVVNISKLNSYNYINGFILTEKGLGATNPGPIVNAGVDQTIILPANSAQLEATFSDPNGFIVATYWQKISGPSQYSIDAPGSRDPIVSNLVEGTYTFRVRITDNDGSSSFDDVNVTVSAGDPTKFVKVNIYGGLNPYNHPEWNNWNISTLSSGLLKYSNGTNSTISASLSQQNAISDNGTTYSGSIAPEEVLRYASYSGSNRTLTISGLDNSKTYNLEIYASRKGVSNNTSRFTIGSTVIDIITDNNLTNKASFVSISPAAGQITISISRLNTYNYINGFVLTENGSSSSESLQVTAPSILKKDQERTLTGIYPNPVRSNLNLQLNNNYTGQMKVQVVNVNGAIVKEFRLVKTNKGVYQTNLSVNDLSQGQYIIRIQMGSLLETKKISKF